MTTFSEIKSYFKFGILFIFNVRKTGFRKFSPFSGNILCLSFGQRTFGSFRGIKLVSLCLSEWSMIRRIRMRTAVKVVIVVAVVVDFPAVG